MKFRLLSFALCVLAGCADLHDFSAPGTVASDGAEAVPVVESDLPAAGVPAAKLSVFDPNDFTGNDSERINAALRAAASCQGTVVVGKRASRRYAGNISTMEERDIWLLESAIIVPGNVTLIFDNCTVQLADSCRDNIIRSSNYTRGGAPRKVLQNIRICGRGNAVLRGAANPRATGDSVKFLYKPGFHTGKKSSYGTDAGKPGEHPRGDWRNIGILLANVEGFTLENLTIRDSHSWAVSLEYCKSGRVRDIEFHSTGRRSINGKSEVNLNQDGLDLRRGCRNILIENISGETGDDLIALTALPSKNVKPVPSDDICDVIIRNVRGYCAGGHHIVRFLNNGGIKMYRITLDGLTDTSPRPGISRAAIRIGDANPAWGGITPPGDTRQFHLKNIHSNARHAILIAGSLCDSVIDGVINCNPDGSAITFQSGKKNTRNLIVSGIINGKL